MARRRTSAPRPTPQGNDFSWAVLPSISLARSVRPVLTPPRAGARGGNLSWAQAPGVLASLPPRGKFFPVEKIRGLHLVVSSTNSAGGRQLPKVVHLSAVDTLLKENAQCSSQNLAPFELQRLIKLPHVSSDSKKQACSKGQRDVELYEILGHHHQSIIIIIWVLKGLVKESSKGLHIYILGFKEFPGSSVALFAEFWDWR